MKHMYFAVVMCAALAVPFSAHASGYVGVNVGRADHKVTFDGDSESEDKTGFKLYGGFGFNQNFGMEAGYVDLGKFSETDGTDSFSYKAESLYVAGTAKLPVSEQFSLFAKAGITANRAKFSVLFAGLNGSENQTNTTALFGVGAEYSFTPKLGLVAEYENFGKTFDEEGVNFKADMFSVGLRYKF